MNLEKLKAFFVAVRVRIKAKTPLFFKTISNIANWLYGVAMLIQPDIIDAINAFAGIPLEYAPEFAKWLRYISVGLAFFATGVKLVAKVTANLAKMTEAQIEKINPAQPEIVDDLRKKFVG